MDVIGEPISVIRRPVERSRGKYWTSTRTREISRPRYWHLELRSSECNIECIRIETIGNCSDIDEFKCNYFVLIFFFKIHHSSALSLISSHINFAPDYWVNIFRKGTLAEHIRVCIMSRKTKKKKNSFKCANSEKWLISSIKQQALTPSVIHIAVIQLRSNYEFSILNFNKPFIYTKFTVCFSVSSFHNIFYSLMFLSGRLRWLLGVFKIVSSHHWQTSFSNQPSFLWRFMILHRIESEHVVAELPSSKLSDYNRQRFGERFQTVSSIA